MDTLYDRIRKVSLEMVHQNFQNLVTPDALARPPGSPGQGRPPYLRHPPPFSTPSEFIIRPPGLEHNAKPWHLHICIVFFSWIFLPWSLKSNWNHGFRKADYRGPIYP